MIPNGYGSPGAFRRALTDRLREVAATSPWSVQQLQRQMAYDRLLERLYSADDSWVVKGAAALIARDIGVRETVDVDVYRSAERDVAEADLRAAAARDIGDWFRFELAPSTEAKGVEGGLRLPVAAYIGATEWCTFRVDLVGIEIRMTDEPERVPPLVDAGMPDLEQRGYRVYPLVDHIADKVTAIIQTYGAAGAPSTRFKDLVDLVAIVGKVTVAADPQMAALRSEADRRGLTLPASFSVPDRALWERGYAAEAERSLLATGRTLDEALAVVIPFLNPLLDATARGRWNPEKRRWLS